MTTTQKTGCIFTLLLAAAIGLAEPQARPEKQRHRPQQPPAVQPAPPPFAPPPSFQPAPPPDQPPMLAGMDIERRIRMLDRFLNLTDEQYNAIEEILEQNKPKIDQTRQQLRDVWQKLHQAVMQGDTDLTQTLAKQMSEALTAQILTQTQMMKAVREQLTDQQRQQLDDLKSQFQQRRQQRRGQPPADWQPDDGQPYPPHQPPMPPRRPMRPRWQQPAPAPEPAP